MTTTNKKANARRIRRGLKVRHMIRESGLYDKDCWLRDALADLMHALGESIFNVELESAQNHYREELAGHE
jgi:hypothetical protein